MGPWVYAGCIQRLGYLRSIGRTGAEEAAVQVPGGWQTGARVSKGGGGEQGGRVAGRWHSSAGVGGESESPLETYRRMQTFGVMQPVPAKSHGQVAHFQAALS